MKNIILIGLSVGFVGCQSAPQAASQDLAVAPMEKETPSVAATEKKRSYSKFVPLSFFKNGPSGKLELIETGSSVKLEFEAKNIEQGTYLLVLGEDCQKKSSRKIDEAQIVSQFDVKTGQSFYFEEKIQGFSLENPNPEKKQLSGALNVYVRNKGTLSKCACADLK